MDVNKALHNFYWNFKALRKKKGIPTYKVEEEIGVSHGYLSRERDLPLTRACAVANELGVSLSDLLEKDFYREERISELQKEIDRLKDELKELNGDEE